MYKNTNGGHRPSSGYSEKPRLNGYLPDDKHWITRLKESSKKETVRLNDEDINNIWFMYSATGGQFKRWLSDGVLMEKIRKEPVGHQDQLESVKVTIRKISDAPLKQHIISAR